MKIITFLLLIILFLTSSPLKSDSYECNATLFEEGSPEIHTENLSIHKKIFLKVMCSGLTPGEQTISAIWINPVDKVYANNSQIVNVLPNKTQTVYFWFKLRRGQSRFIRKFFGSDFQRENYGAWKVYVYSEGNLATSNEFTLQ